MVRRERSDPRTMGNTRRRRLPPIVPGAACTISSPNRRPEMTLSTDQQLLIEQRVTNDGKNVVVAYLLWFFLGVFSAHRFYLGRPGTAILQILSYFILIGFIWWLVDFFLIPGMIRDSNEGLRRRLGDELRGR